MHIFKLELRQHYSQFFANTDGTAEKPPLLFFLLISFSFLFFKNGSSSYFFTLPLQVGYKYSVLANRPYLAHFLVTLSDINQSRLAVTHVVKYSYSLYRGRRRMGGEGGTAKVCGKTMALNCNGEI